MANTVLTGGSQQNIINVSAMDEDWDAGYERPLHSIQFNTGSDADDVLVVKAGSAAGPILLSATADAADDEICKYFDGIKVRAFIDYSDCTLSAGHKVIIVFKEDY